MKHVKSEHPSCVHLWTAANGKRLNLHPGVNHVTDDLAALFAKQLKADPKLMLLDDLSEQDDDDLEAGEELSEEESGEPQMSVSRKRGRKKKAEIS